MMSCTVHLVATNFQQSGAKEKAETSSRCFRWQILCGKDRSTVNVQTLAEAASIFTVCDANNSPRFPVLDMSKLM